MTTRKLEYRSILGSYWYAKSLKKHNFKGYNELSTCGICGWSSWKRNPENYNFDDDVNTYNFERFKWGGVGHCYKSYALFDLEQFIKMEHFQHTDEDERILHDILACAYELSPTNKAGALQKLITSKKILKSNKQEVCVLLNILGICGVLSSSKHPCYYDRFANVTVERDPPELTNDFEYPVNWWRASDGINEECYERVFGKPFIL